MDDEDFSISLDAFESMASGARKKRKISEAKEKKLLETLDSTNAHSALDVDQMGYMTKSLAIATLPHSKTLESPFIRKNGSFTLSMSTGHPDGLAYGLVPRKLLAFVCTEAVKTGSPVISLELTEKAFLRKLGMKGSGGRNGDLTRFREQSSRLFSSTVHAFWEKTIYDQASGKKITSNEQKSWLLSKGVQWWSVDDLEEGHERKWFTEITLTNEFYDDIKRSPVPIDMRAVDALSSSLAVDIYIWLTHRMFRLKRRTQIPWATLQKQFGSNFGKLADFKVNFVKQLNVVLYLYPKAKVKVTDKGLVLDRSPPHVEPIQRSLEF